MRRLSWFLVAIPLVACSASSRSQFGSSGNGSGGGATSTSGGGGEGGDGSGTGGIDFGTGGAGGGGDPLAPAEVYGHSASTLYKLDPLTKGVSVVGPFQGCSGILDLAMDAESNIVASTSSGLWRIDKATAACTLIASGSYPNSLSFLPEGTLLPDAEALVGYQGATYIRIDSNNGQVSTVGALGGGYFSSGDIVSVKGGATFLTVKGPGCNDCLIEVDPKTGALSKNWGPVGYTDVFGLAFWGGSAYGFANGGQLFQVSFQQQSVSSTPIPVPNPPPGLSFWGAGSSTLAPIDIPQ